MKTYVINLKSSEERRRYVLQEVTRYANMEVELVDAVNGLSLSPCERDKQFDIKLFMKRYGRFPLPGEIGCTLSHRECYRRLLESEEEIALILEDDIFFYWPEDVEKVINCCVEMLIKKKGGITIFSYAEIVFSGGRKLIGRYSLNRIWLGYGTHAYLLHRNAAKKLYKTKPSLVADDYEYINMKGVKVYGVLPQFSKGISSSGEVQTEIQVSRDNIPFDKKIFLKYKCRFLLTKIFRKSMIFLHVMSIVKFDWAKYNEGKNENCTCH